ncbi:14344_t:CDS:2, partial [Acaulospora morrowiae]
MYGTVSTAVDWVIIKLASSNPENNNRKEKVEVLLSSFSPSPLPINKAMSTHDDLEAILEILPEVSADDYSVVGQLEQHAPVYKVNDVVSEVLSEVNFKLPEEREMGKLLNEAHKESVSDKKRQHDKKKKFQAKNSTYKNFDDSDEIELTKKQNIELYLIRDLQNEKLYDLDNEEILSWIRYSELAIKLQKYKDMLEYLPGVASENDQNHMITTEDLKSLSNTE